MNSDAWTKAVDLGTIATSLMIIAVAILVLLSRSNKPHRSGKK